MKVTKRHIDVLTHAVALLENKHATEKDIKDAVKITSFIMKNTVGMNEDWLNFMAIYGERFSPDTRQRLYNSAMNFLGRLIPYVQKD